MVEGESADGRLELLHGSRCSISRFQEVAVEKTREMNILKPFGLSSPMFADQGGLNKKRCETSPEKLLSINFFVSKRKKW